MGACYTVRRSHISQARYGTECNIDHSRLFLAEVIAHRVVSKPTMVHRGSLPCDAYEAFPQILLYLVYVPET